MNIMKKPNSESEHPDNQVPKIHFLRKYIQKNKSKNLYFSWNLQTGWFHFNILLIKIKF